MPAEGGEAIQLTTGRGRESFESPDGKLLYYEDFGGKGLGEHSHDESLPQVHREGSPVLRGSSVSRASGRLRRKESTSVSFGDTESLKSKIQDVFGVIAQLSEIVPSVSSSD